MNLTFRQMEILVAAAEAATFSAAAKKLGISQPSLSESVSRIERAAGLCCLSEPRARSNSPRKVAAQQRSHARWCRISRAV